MVSATKIFLPIISIISSQLKNDSGFSLIEEDIFSTRNNEFLLVLEELQNANVSNNIDSTTRHRTACTPQTKNSTFGVSAKQKHFFCIS